MPHRRPARRAATVLIVLASAACAQTDAMMADRARRELVGVAADDIRLCAGVPNRASATPRAEYWTYDRAPPPGGGFNLVLPVIGGVSLSGAADCRATFELVGGRVSRLGLSGASQVVGARDAACRPIVTGCLDMLRDGEIARE